ncbi:zinc-finger domain-containing protein [Paenibacillus xylanilyticus]|uniref:Zinc-finger domain-containing protein n=1 Tax=Paenibacillus xylanilyticus TaxID=248903 RepID=A0A7Y6BYN9_9BACL|nr:zinc-finger domain-containing protein [Paenibacillus xylanilyticus]NUU76936.1 zinc-finger domain-containing protein [Paenibacillus xylanilyticus]
MLKDSGWTAMKEIATANNVTHAAYLKRRYSGYSPEEAASSKEDLKEIRTIKTEKQAESSEQSMTRQDALQEIDRILISKCDPCETRIKLSNRSTQLTNVCNNECPVGKQIQELGKRLKVAPRRSVLEDRKTNRG